MARRVLSAEDGAERWNALELRHLVALRAISEHGTFAAAAASLGYTQSAISQQLAALERIVCQRLVERAHGRRPTGVTAAGELLLQHGQALFARVRAARADLAGLIVDAAVPLRVGVYQSVAVHILPAVLKRFTVLWPQIPIDVREASGDAELLAALRSGDLDLTFAVLPVPDGPFETVHLMDDPYVIGVHARSPRAEAGQAMSLQDLADQPLIAFRTCRNEQRIEQYLLDRGIKPNVVFRTDDNMVLQAMVKSGAGAALVPQLSMRPTDACVALLMPDTPLPPRELGLVWHRDRDRSASAMSFIDISAAVSAER